MTIPLYMAVPTITEARLESHILERCISKNALVKKSANYVAFSKFTADDRELKRNLK